MNVRLTAVLAACALAATFAVSRADATISPKPQGAETAFVTSIQKDLMARFPTAADAEKAGYFRYTNEDDTGAISYANLQWQSARPATSQPALVRRQRESARRRLLGSSKQIRRRRTFGA